MAKEYCYYTNGPSCACNCEDADGSVTSGSVPLTNTLGTGNSAECCHSDCVGFCGFSKYSKPQQSALMMGADGKIYEGKTEIGGVDVPKVLVALGVAVAAFYIMKKMK